MNIPKLPEKPYKDGEYLDAYSEPHAKWRNWYECVLVPWHASVFKGAVEVYGTQYESAKGWAFDQKKIDETTHTALLINIRPIKEETAEDLLKDYLMEYEKFLRGAF